MKIEINKIKQLFDSDISGYKISQETGLSQGLIYEYKRGDKKVENMTLETAEKLMKFIKENEMKEMIYLRIVETETDGWIEDYDTLEEANNKADEYWYYLTKYEKERTRVYVLGLKKEDYDKVKNDETDRWYGDFADDSLDTFDSDNLK
ncbi:hypothetical protein [Helcococcus kunzii]|uniref:hypothetical protein n=1 Tax=Helcococcus kunzii TaxID=40091 RepID=UPI001BAFCF4C|nr:hypothetical protein [Helcococcus kunzii]